jgi:hypothetical protein
MPGVPRPRCCNGSELREQKLARWLGCHCIRAWRRWYLRRQKGRLSRGCGVECWKRLPPGGPAARSLLM